MAEQEWIDNGWNIAVKLLNTLEPDGIPCVSKEPAFIYDDRFIVYYAKTLGIDQPKEFWIMTGDLPPAMIAANEVEDEREAIKVFGEIYQHDGKVIMDGANEPCILPEFVIGNMKNDPNFGQFLNSVGAFLSEMGRSFPWEQVGINGKELIC